MVGYAVHHSWSKQEGNDVTERDAYLFRAIVRSEIRENRRRAVQGLEPLPLSQWDDFSRAQKFYVGSVLGDQESEEQPSAAS